ncbi:MAG: hypothetical protein HKO86_05135 [Gammaproteobacteria bacterium]|nr:hypothetical protein [Gammaproteobacteria bacterium]
MKVGLCILLTFVTVIVGNTSSHGYVVETKPEAVKPVFHEPQEIIESYLRAVDRGEMVVFDTVLDKTMLVPVSVEYVYELDNPTPKIKVYSKLKQSMPVPGQQDCELRAVSAILDADGHILETEAHIWAE